MTIAVSMLWNGVASFCRVSSLLFCGVVVVVVALAVIVVIVVIVVVICFLVFCVVLVC